MVSASGRRLLRVALVAAVLGGGVVPFAAPVAAGSSFVHIDSTVAPTQPTTDGNFTVTTTVANSARSDDDYVVRNVRVIDGVAVDEDERLNAVRPRERLRPGESGVANVSVGVDEAGTHALLVRTELMSGSGQVRTVDRVLDVDVRQPHPVVGVEFEPTVPGSPTNATVTVANGLERPIRNVELRLAPERTNLSTRSHVFAVVDSGAERSLDVEVSGRTVGTETVAARLAYSYNGTRYAAERTLRGEFVEPSNPGRVTLTNLRVERVGDALRLRGTASNPGGTAVTGVTVSVLDGENVGPAADNAEFFVGRVAASDFGTFETLAAPRTNGSVTVPVRVTYLVDGVQRETVREVEYAPPPESEPTRTGPPVPTWTLGVGGVALVAGVGLVVRRVRRE
jgi:hypothetical protein